MHHLYLASGLLEGSLNFFSLVANSEKAWQWTLLSTESVTDEEEESTDSSDFW